MNPFGSIRGGLLSIALRFRSFLTYNLRRCYGRGGEINHGWTGCGSRIPTGGNCRMDKSLIALYLYLNELGIPPAIDTINDRKRVQKPIYLGQATGAELNYDFDWYVHGPYSTELTRDYYRLAEELPARVQPTAGDTQSTDGPRLKDSIREPLKKLAPILQKPEGFGLDQADWMELLSSLHYLRTVDKLDPAEARRIISTQKPHLLQYVDQAERKLEEVRLLP